MQIEQDLLQGLNVQFHHSKNHSGRRKAMPTMIVIHYTSGSSLSSAVSTLCDPKSKASAHLVLDRTKHIVQLLPFNLVGWHCGKSSWKGKGDLNHASIGIELVNYGRLELSANGKCCTWFKLPVAEEEVFIDKKGLAWHQYSEFQITKTIEICQTLCEIYPIQYIVGHSEIAPRRKLDPGSAFDLDRLRDKVFNRNRRDEQHRDSIDRRFVDATGLNLRDKPNIGQSKIQSVLTTGQKVNVEQVFDGWAKVTVAQKGWVKHEYLKK